MVGIQRLEKIYIRNIVYILELKRITSLVNEMTPSLFLCWIMTIWVFILTMGLKILSSLKKETGSRTDGNGVQKI